nr:MAG TPA: hypothetical protein [Caudoviricetes sp.]
MVHTEPPQLPVLIRMAGETVRQEKSRMSTGEMKRARQVRTAMAQVTDK